MLMWLTMTWRHLDLKKKNAAVFLLCVVAVVVGPEVVEVVDVGAETGAMIVPIFHHTIVTNLVQCQERALVKWY